MVARPGRGRTFYSKAPPAPLGKPRPPSSLTKPLTRQSGLELLLDFGLFCAVRAESQGVIPLEARFHLASRLPQGIAQMVVDGGAAGHQQPRGPQSPRRVVIAPQPVIGP